MLRERPGADREGRDDTDLTDSVATRLPPTLRMDDEYRSVLQAVVARDGTCSLSTLTRILVDEGGWSPADDATNPYQQAHIALVREYVPVLVEFGVLEYDEEFGTVELDAPGLPDSR